MTGSAKVISRCSNVTIWKKAVCNRYLAPCIGDISSVHALQFVAVCRFCRVHTRACPSLLDATQVHSVLISVWSWLQCALLLHSDHMSLSSHYFALKSNDDPSFHSSTVSDILLLCFPSQLNTIQLPSCLLSNQSLFFAAYFISIHPDMDRNLKKTHWSSSLFDFIQQRQFYNKV